MLHSRGCSERGAGMVVLGREKREEKTSVWQEGGSV